MLLCNHGKWVAGVPANGMLCVLAAELCLESTAVVCTACLDQLSSSVQLVMICRATIHCRIVSRPVCGMLCSAEGRHQHHISALGRDAAKPLLQLQTRRWHRSSGDFEGHGHILLQCRRYRSTRHAVALLCASSSGRLHIRLQAYAPISDV